MDPKDNQTPPTTPTEPTAAPTPEAPAPAPAGDAGAGATPPAGDAGAAPHKSKSGMLIGLLVLVVALAAAAYFLL